MRKEKEEQERKLREEKERLKKEAEAKRLKEIEERNLESLPMWQEKTVLKDYKSTRERRNVKVKEERQTIRIS